MPPLPRACAFNARVSSLNGVEPLAGGAYYAASKFAIEGFSASLAAEVAHLGIGVTIIEPAPTRTRFLKSPSAKWAGEIPDYAQSVGKVRTMLRELDNKQPVDPRRAARVIVDSIRGDNPPLHLPLGRLATEQIRHVLGERLEEVAALSGLSATADFSPP